MKNRPPIVTVLGHVDHGKTSLLDAVRKSNIVAREAGGITQKIGASTVTTAEAKRITFIDTPGHAAFSAMRSRGAAVADIALLIVDGSDGIKPQTLESLAVIREAQVPFIVVVTKIDLPSASEETILGQLEKEGVLFEGRGGDVPHIAVSAKTGKSITDLLELISLVADVREIKSDPGADLEAVVIETAKDKRGIVASVVVRNGTLAVGGTVSSEEESFKVRGIFDEKGAPVKEVHPGEAAQILGFGKMPQVGSRIKTFGEISESKIEKGFEKRKIAKDEIPVVIKAENAGSLEAIMGNIPAKITVISSGVGDVFESDILEAKANGAKYLFAFESKATNPILKLASAEGIKVETFSIIYELFQRLEELVKKGQVEILGKAEILAEFPFNNKRVAGCKVINGKIAKSDQLILMRSDKEVGRAKAISLKKQKNEVAEVSAGEEFGVLLEPQLDFKIGDVLVSSK